MTDQETHIQMTDQTANVQRLIDKFAADLQYYTESRGGYLEADVRSEFIDPLLRALGWDVENRHGLIPSRREVVREETQQREDSANKRPDYTLRVDGVGQLYVEAKRPSVNILTDMEAIRQTRAYGWTKQHPIAVLTNFRHIRIFDTSVPLGSEDSSNTALRFECEYRDLNSHWDTVKQLIGRVAVHDTQWLQQFRADQFEAPLPADQRFIEQFNQWRISLGESLVERNESMTEAEVNDAVQRIINRLVFVRMCEDRGIEGEGVLRDAFAGSETDVVSLFRRLNDRYNTALFRDPDSPRDPVLLASATVMKSIVDHLYAPYSPFSFAVLDADFLGLVYESSLAEHLAIESVGGRRTVHLNKKREYAKRDVVTTPQDLVSATVRAAVEEIEVDLPKVLDFAVGSGRFLVSTFDQLIEREVIRRSAMDGLPGLLRIAENTYRLSFDEKRRILEDHCFGIDIDFNAVEVARFGLLIRLLEDETRDTLPARQRKILPDLVTNIVHGNTLVRTMPVGAPAGTEEVTLPITLDQVGLPDHFDLVVGNPPYMSTEQMKSYDKWEFIYVKDHYETTYQQFDKYFAFIEFAAKHLHVGGVLGVVIPNKWMTIEAGPHFRSMLRTSVTARRLANFRHVQVFKGKSIYVCSLIAKRSPATDFRYSEPDSIRDFAADTGVQRTLSSRHLPDASEDPWVLPADATEERVLANMGRHSIRMDDIVEARNGVQTSQNSVYVLKKPILAARVVEFTKNGRTWQIEEAVTRPYLDDSKGIRSHFEVQPDARIIFPYQPTSATHSLSGFEVIPERDMRQHYPLAYQYLTAHRALLDARNVATGERQKAFYVYGRTQAIGYCTQAPKIFYSTNQRGEKYGIDTTGLVYQSGGTAGEVALYSRGTGYSLDFVLALLNQRPIEFFLRKRGSAFRGGYVARGTAVVKDVPVPRLDFNDSTDVEFQNNVSAKMAELRRLHGKTGSMPERLITQHISKIDFTTQQIENLFLTRWELSTSDVTALRL